LFASRVEASKQRICDGTFPSSGNTHSGLRQDLQLLLPAREGEASFFNSGSLSLVRKVSGGSGANLCAGMRSELQHIHVPVRTEDSAGAQPSASFCVERGSGFGSADPEKSLRRRHWRLGKAPHRTLAGLPGALYRLLSKSALSLFWRALRATDGLMLWRTDSPSGGSDFRSCGHGRGQPEGRRRMQR
jgi:hypothetical protein